MNLKNIHSVYFLGIGGIGMSALARWFKSQGMEVSGYDRTETDLTKALVSEGISIHYEDDVKLINQGILNNPENSLIIFTPAIPSEHKQKNHLIDQGFTLYKRSEVLGFISAEHFTIAVAGTHGKTSTTSIIAHILHSSGVNCAAFVGGIMANYGSNLILPTKEGQIIVVAEADEFDRSFLRLNPDLAVITAADPDHLDIYGDGDHLKQSFRDFIEKISEEGKLFVKERVASELEIEEMDGLNQYHYDLLNGSIHADNLHVSNDAFIFDYVAPGNKIEQVALHFPGRHNVENTLAAISVALEVGLTADQIKGAIATYRGVKRRFEYVIRNSSCIYIDDYAHHPEEIKAFLGALRELYPGRKITAIFQPHLYTRTRDFAEGFAESLALADEVMLIPIYPARELPIEGVSSQMIGDLIPDNKCSLMEKEEALHYVESNDMDVIATIGAGDIDQLVQPIKNILEAKA